MHEYIAAANVSDPGTSRGELAPEIGEQVLLAIDTALGTSVALGAGGRVFEASSADVRGHAEAIGPLLVEVLSRADVEAGAITGVVAGIGPGPFTGLRVGIAAAHAFALGRGVPLLPLQGHEAVALEAFGAPRFDPRVTVVQDAKRRELFVTEFSGLDDDGIPVRVREPRLVPRSEHVAAPGELWPDRIPAGGLVRLAARRLAARRAFEPDHALYLRAPDARPSAPKRVIP